MCLSTRTQALPGSIFDYISTQEIYVATGTVKWFNASKGFGFIQADDGSKDVFVHISAVEKAGLSTLNEGQKIQYELQKGQDGKTSAGDLKSI
jgi:CspA family cold shock protein